jgi:hypothetical protein
MQSTMIRTVKTTLLAALLLAAALQGQQERQFVPQIADGGGWQTTLTIVNTSRTVEGFVELKFYDPNGIEMPLPISGVGAVTTLVRRVRPAGTLVLETSGSAPATISGWALVVSGADPLSPTPAAPVTVFTTFRSRIFGRPDFEAAVFPVAGTTNQLTMPLDNTGGTVSSYALANGTGFNMNVRIVFADESGQPFLEENLGMAPWGQTSFESTNRFPLTRSKRGTVTFQAPTAAGRLGAIGLRFNPTGPFSTLPSMTYR